MTTMWFVVLLLVVVGDGVVHTDVSVDCDSNYMVVVMWAERRHGTGDPYLLLLGNCLPVQPSTGKVGRMEAIFSAQLDDCNFRRTITESQVIYSNELSYMAEAGDTPTIYPVECVYERVKDWTPPLYVPAWNASGYGDLLFHVAIMNADFSGPAQSSTFHLGSLIPIWAAVDQQTHLPLLLLLDECVATTSPGLDPSGPVYPIITNRGCLLDSKVGRSRFLPRVKTSELQLYLQAFKFALDQDVYIHCKLLVWDPQSLDEGKKTCDFSKDKGRWELLDDPSQSSLCSCCDSHCKYRKTRGVELGLLRDAVLGPLVIQGRQDVEHDANPLTAQQLEIGKKMALSGWVCLVTGASRGIGRGIALQLSEAGATVYITGRQEKTLQETAVEVKERGGGCVPVICDSSKEDDIKGLFERIRLEQKGRLDILVNNAYSGVQEIFDNMGKKFWETDPSIWDSINNTGLRGHYFCSVYAARLMVAQGRGLIVVISSMGGLKYIFNVPYGVGKAACDRLAADTAVELKGRGVASVSLWPGAVKTELVTQLIVEREAQPGVDPRFKEVFSSGETTEMSGKCIVELAKDKNLMSLTGKVLMTCDLARRYGIQDVDGRSVTDYTSLSFLISQVPYLSWLSAITPSFLRVPRFVLTLSGGRF
ncbi:hypothetical protein AAFF_G00151880 [Aldrovandia affinis]|uniref:ZP domain-containing protein n=1 Tax=Aldrovandia affinis TaxID=143900 RepID=A0AAD7RNP2_9TELE|nr:hypothetical protein AAFF_G00151880 [Aldrovandia affinis]